MTLSGYVFLAILAFFVVFLAIKWRRTVAFFKQVRLFSGEVRTELGKVTWPSKEEVINSTIMVGIVTIILTVIVWGVDLLFGRAVSWLF